MLIIDLELMVTKMHDFGGEGAILNLLTSFFELYSSFDFSNKATIVQVALFRHLPLGKMLIAEYRSLSFMQFKKNWEPPLL